MKNAKLLPAPPVVTFGIYVKNRGQSGFTVIERAQCTDICGGFEWAPLPTPAGRWRFEHSSTGLSRAVPTGLHGAAPTFGPLGPELTTLDFVTLTRLRALP